MVDDTDTQAGGWRRRLRERWPLMVSLGVGIVGGQPLVRFCADRGGVWWLLFAGFLVAWFVVTGYFEARERARERARAQARERRARRERAQRGRRGQEPARRAAPDEPGSPPPRDRTEALSESRRDQR